MDEKKDMFELTVDEIYHCIESNLILAALHLSMTVIDMCAIAEYGKSSGTKFRNWYNKYINIAPEYTNLKITLSGGEAYQLRCDLLHSGCTEIKAEKNKKQKKNKDIDPKLDFFIIFQQQNDTPKVIGESSIACLYNPEGNIEEHHILKMNPYNFCRLICEGATDYYKKNIVVLLTSLNEAGINSQIILVIINI